MKVNVLNRIELLAGLTFDSKDIDNFIDAVKESVNNQHMKVLKDTLTKGKPGQLAQRIVDYSNKFEVAKIPFTFNAHLEEINFAGPLYPFSYKITNLKNKKVAKGSSKSSYQFIVELNNNLNSRLDIILKDLGIDF